METKKHLFHWCRVPIRRTALPRLRNGGDVSAFVWKLSIVMFVLMFGRSLNVHAAMDFGQYSRIIHNPTIDQPWIELRLTFYDTNGSDSFFRHDNGGPYITVDGEFSCNADWELAWPGSDGLGNNDDLEKERKNDGWWGHTYKNTVNDKNYEVSFFDPANNSGRYEVTIVIYCRQIDPFKAHTVTVGGAWKTNGTNMVWQTQETWTTTPIDNPYPTPTAIMTDYSHFNLSGELNYNYGSTVIGTGTPWIMSLYYPQEKLSGVMEYAKGKSSYKEHSMPFSNRKNFYNPEAKYIEYIIKRPIESRGDFYLYHWFTVYVPGFVRATDLQTESDIWNRSITVKWNPDESDGRSKEGGWRIYRTLQGAEDWRPLTSADLPYSQRIFVDEDANLAYDTDYEYKVIFIPKNSPAGEEHEELSQTVTGNLKRSFTFSDLAASETFEDKIVFSWKHTAYQNASSQNYILTVQRSKSDPTLPADQMVWQDVKIYNISSKTTTSGSYEDEQDLESFQDYSYRLKTTVFDKDYVSEKVTGHLAGMSYVTDLSATRGTYSNMVKLKWTAKQIGTTLTYYDVQRRPLGSQDDDAWMTLNTVSGIASSYTYDDVSALPGSYSQYRLVTWTTHNNERKGNSTKMTDGFSVATGVISGRITYGNGTAVEGVKVTLLQNTADGKTMNAMRSLRFTGAKTGMIYNTTSKDLKKLFSKDFSVQLFVSPSPNEMGDDGATYSLINVAGLFDINLTYDAANRQYFLGAKMGTEAEISTLAIPQGEWRHLTCVYNAAAGTTTFYVTKDGELQQTAVLAGSKLDMSGNDDKTATKVSIAYLDDETQPTFKGYVDEFRVFTKVLGEQDILKNYNHPLAGSENGLGIYWPMDEGIEGQTIAYDFSKTNNVNNGRHGVTEQAAISSDNVPSEKELSLMGYTNEQGTYEIRGIPFSGEGTSYTITPTMGVHEFKAAYLSRFINMSMLNHSGVDFEDVSSFPVSGVAYYDHTTIPVEGAYLYVDGTMSSKDGEPIMTDSKGKFTIDVPIGDHFIQIKKQGHTFKYDGRYPSDPNSTGYRETFESPKENLTFYDKTTVPVAGRVAGGDIEFEKPLGLGLGIANIGKAQLRLELSNENGFLNVDDQDPNSTTFSYNQSAKQRDFTTASGKAYVPGSKNFITVETDAETGEWVAQLPPLRYDVTEVVIPSNPAITKKNFSLPVIDATNPNLIYTDSVETENGIIQFDYVASAKMEYKSQSTIEVTEHDDGSFGMDSYEVKDVNGKKHTVTLYEMDENGNAILDANGKVQYTFGVSADNPNGYPVYREMDTYRYHLYAYERYTNYDGTEPVVNEVPLAGKEVTIKNQYASTTAVDQKNGSVGEMVDDKLELDDHGQAVYQFRVGFPNIQAPYTRGLSISYDNNGTEMSWSGNDIFQAIILGGLPTGNNFVTQGPDEVLMVLRDPPGTNSQTTWTKGTSLITSNSYTNEFHSQFEIGSTIYAGVKEYTGAGGVFIVINEVEAVANINIGAQYNAQRTSYDSHTITTTATRDISTSDAADFVGACGDVFIGSAKNIIFGACRAVDIQWNNATGKAELIQDDAMSMGEEFTTGFAYTQNHIKEVLIPNFEKLRNELLTPVADVSSVQRPAKGEDPIYVTTLDKNNPKYGTSNSDEDVWEKQAVPFSKLKDGIYKGPSYTMLLPIDYEKDKDGMQDMVQFYNTQIKRWERELYKNEEAKVKVIQDREKWLKENHSFSAGPAITVSVTNEKEDSYTDTDVDEVNAVIGGETGHMWSGVGLEVRVSETIGRTFTDDSTHTHVVTNTMSYKLEEDGDDDYLSVDVFDAPDGFSPIFVTRGGATSCPYEDEVVTDYYKPGTVISAKTVQIEKPEIEAQTQLITGIPAGGTGTFKVNIRNNSDTNEDIWYDLLVAPDSNPDGLVVSMDGVNLNKGTTVLVEARKTMVKTITVSQTNPDVLNYENVKLRIASQCQKDNTSTYHEIADTTEFSVYFQPACSDISLASTHTLVNSDTETPVTLSISDYNYSMASLKGIRLEYKAANDADFRTLQEYTKDKNRLQSDPNLKELIPLEGTNKLTYLIDLRKDDFADRTYVFRAVTICDQGGVEVNNESMEIEIIRDMNRPMLIATPTPANGILASGDDLLITFNEDIQGSILTEPNNFDVVGVLNEGEVAHDVALSLTGDNPAKTEATISLGGKSFTTNMWVNYSTDGTLLTHGTADCNFSIAIENGKLAVSVAGQKITSTEALPKDKWLYLNVAYEASAADGSTAATLNASYAKDAETVTLINSVATKAYTGNGPLSVGGNGLIAKVQELAFWNQNRSMAEAQADMHLTKNPYTDGLIGYWQLNEGRGKVATDRARSRNMILPSQNAWWIDGANYALTLDGTKTATINIGALNTTNKEDYLIETWFKADKTQNGVASVLGTQKMDLRLNAQGQMELLLGSTADVEAKDIVPISNNDLRDGQWHHVAVSVLKSVNGGGSVYLDGLQAKLLSASTIPVLYGDKLMLGGRRVETVGTDYNFTQQLKGAIDEVRIWKGRRTADVIKNYMYTRVKADEAGLVAYYPMEKNGLDDYNQIVATSTFDDAVTAGTQNVATMTFFNANADALPAQTADLSSVNTASLKQAPRMENVQFSFVASERQIKVNLEEKPAARIEGCHIYITAKNVKDMNGNVAEPITWGVYVQRNNLRWQEQEIAITKSGIDPATFSTTIENVGAENEAWSVTGMPSWLKVNMESGSLMPLSSGTLTFTVAESLPIGTYETTVYLTGSKDINAPLNVSVTSEGQVPLWSVNPRDFENSMNVIGHVELQGMPMNDEKDIVAAFIGEECRGVSHLEYKERYDGYYVTMDIYGNADDGKAVTFRAYDASTGTVYPAVEPDRTIKFEPLALIGKYDAPVMFNVLDKVEQSTDLKAGWNWISLNVTTSDMGVESIFENIAEDVSIIKSQNDGWLMHEEGEWGGNMTVALNNTQMYAVKMLDDRTLRIVGTGIDPKECKITVYNGWNWIGYYGRQIAPVSEAMADMQPENGDILKAQSGVTYFDSKEWAGSINMMEPGKGYMVNSGTDVARTFGYYSTANDAYAPLRISPDESYTVQPANVFKPVDFRTYSGNAIMAAKVIAAGKPMANTELGVFADGECRATAITNENGVAYLTIPGDDAATLSFKVVVDNQEAEAAETLNYESDIAYGSPKHPFIIDLNNATNIEIAETDGTEDEIYDLQGRKITTDISHLGSGIYIINGIKQVVR